MLITSIPYYYHLISYMEAFLTLQTPSWLKLLMSWKVLREPPPTSSPASALQH